MITLTEGAFAKVNLTLDVLDRREDGYHDISSIMQAISLRDDIEIDLDTGKPWKLTCDKENVPTDERNLAWKAARVFFDALGGEPDGVEIRITKRISSEAGLGGGSADVAALLRILRDRYARALNRHRGYPLSVYALCELGAQVGSDVPFCVLGGTALCEGRGERLTKLPDAPEMIFVVCKPDLALSTPELYAKLDTVTIAKRPETTAMRAALQRGDLEEIGKNLCNVFEQVTIGMNILLVRFIVLYYIFSYESMHLLLIFI